MQTGDPILLTIGIVVPLGILYASIYGPIAALFSELFSTKVRYTGISFVYQFSGIFAGGLTPLIAVALLQWGDNKPWYIASYLVVVSVISFISSSMAKDQTGVELSEIDKSYS
jgi:MFS family permease